MKFMYAGTLFMIKTGTNHTCMRMPWPVCEPSSQGTGVSIVLPHQAEVKLVGVWLCVSLLCVCVCVCISKYVAAHVCSYPHLHRSHAATPLTPASLFVLQISLIFCLCGRRAQFCAVTLTHISVIILGLRIRRTRIHRDTRARRHVRSSISTRSLLLPNCFCFPFHMKCDTRRASDFAFARNIFTQQRVSWKEKKAICGWLNDFHDHLFPVSPRNHVRWLFAGFESFFERQGSTDLTDLHASYVKIGLCEDLSKPIDLNIDRSVKNRSFEWTN